MRPRRYVGELRLRVAMVVSTTILWASTVMMWIWLWQYRAWVVVLFAVLTGGLSAVMSYGTALAFAPSLGWAAAQLPRRRISQANWASHTPRALRTYRPRTAPTTSSTRASRAPGGWKH